MKKNKKKLSEPVKSKKPVVPIARFKPHKSFQITRKRDNEKRSLEMPGYFGFTKHVFQTLWLHKNTFLLLALVYSLATLFMVGIASQDTYNTFKDSLTKENGYSLTGAVGEVGKASILFLSTITGNLSNSLSDVQQVYAVIIMLLVWLTTIWLLRNILAGHKVKLRDGIYSSGSPVFGTSLVALLMLVQMLPFALALVILYAASETGMLDGGVEAMLCWFAAGLFTILSVYWIVGTFFALVIVTLPGMYPMRAIKAAGDLVAGRRLRLIKRVLWMLLVVVVSWAVIMIPSILFDSWIKSIYKVIDWLPTIPILALVLSSLTMVWISSYIYLLYRRVVADDSNSI